MTAATDARSPILAERVALVTGASRGLGAAVARALAAAGAHVILAARTVAGLEQVDDAIRVAGAPPATLIPLDLRDGDQIDQLAAAIFARFARLDVLVGAAGVLGPLTPVGDVAVAAWDEVMRVNVTANWRLIRAFDTPLRRSDAGRAIFVTSSVASGQDAYFAPYAASKAALDALVRSYAAETKATALRVNLVDPGVLRTRLRAQAFPGEDPSHLAPPERVAPVFVDLAAPACRRHGQTIRAF